MKFLISLIRRAWVPDALAQMKFSPKPKSADVSRLIKRAVTVGRIFHETIPEELVVHEAEVNKGQSMKRQRIQGRGRTGVGYKRWSNVSVKLRVADFDGLIKCARTQKEKSEWMRRKDLVAKIKAGEVTGLDAALTLSQNSESG
jgi:large subunit ribosomal protein L22